MSLQVIFSFLLVHWIADFVLQTDKQARGKSKNWSDLLSHTSSYSAVWIPSIVLVCYLENIELTSVKIPALFFLITFACHTITDYFTSRLNSKLYAKGEIHDFFVMVGFDQVLHYVQLFLTFYFLR